MKVKFQSVLIYLFCVFVISISIFCYGFFPLSFSSTEKASRDDFPDDIDGLSLNKNSYKPRTSRTVLMIIDALRSDFVHKTESLPFLNELLANGSACTFQIVVHPPTVTMPRIKAMTSGTIPSFLDVVLNLGSAEMTLDTFLHQMHSFGQKIIFYGDDTWVKMFPETFHRKIENMDSLFVNDFYEGDKNITWNMRMELTNYDWKLMIMHYLGLDHIGHVEGPFSPKVPAKLKEMDDVIREIYGSMLKWNKKFVSPSLFFITGDHGMRDSGGHGGSSHAETHVPLIVIGNNCSSAREMYQQIDIAATLSILMGVPIPATSIGSIIPEILSEFSGEDVLYASYYNTKKLLEKAKNFYKEELESKEFYIQFKEAELLHKRYLENVEENLTVLKQSLLKYYSVSRELSRILVKNYIKYDLFTISVGLVLCFMTALLLGLILVKSKETDMELPVKLSNWVAISISGLLLKSFLQKIDVSDTNLLQTNVAANIFLLLVFACLYVHYNIFAAINELKIMIPKGLNKLQIYFIFCTTFHTLSLASSSFIEEEHQTWYYFTNTLFLYIILTEIRKLNVISVLSIQFSVGVNEKYRRKMQKDYYYLKWFILSSVTFHVCHINLRRLNQTGDKWLKLEDYGDWFIKDENKIWLSFLLVFGLCYLLYHLNNYSGLLTTILSLTACILIYYFRATTESVLLFKLKPYKSDTCLIILWINILEIFCINYIPKVYRCIILKKAKRKDLEESFGALIVIFCLISSLLHKPHNVILNGMLICSSKFVNKSLDNIIDEKDVSTKVASKVLAHIWMGKMFYFYQGNSNNLASIDLNAGYVGLSSFNFILVGFFLTINTYNGQLLSFLLLVHDLIKNKYLSTLETSLKCFSATTIFPFSFFVLIVTILRDHIFVWTVFSPKIFYDFYSMFLTFLKMWVLYFVFK